jgi:hypothetical protein
VYVKPEIKLYTEGSKCVGEVCVTNDDGRPLYGAMVTGATFGEVTAKIEAFLQGRVINAKQQ